MQQHVIEQQTTARQRILDCYNVPVVTVVQEPVTLNKSLSDELVKASIDDMIEKGGEGSRGGKVIGHTKSGKPIYDSFIHEGHKNFTKEDHEDAHKLHHSIADKTIEDTKNFYFGGSSQKNRNAENTYHYHQSHGNSHKREAASMKKKKDKSEVKKSDEEIRIETIIKSDIDDMIEKGEISDQLGRGYGPGAEAMKFNKKGSEIKTQIPGMISSLETERTKLTVQLELLQEKIGQEPTQEYNTQLAPDCPKQYVSDYCYPKYDEQIKGYPDSTEEHKLCSKFNSICYMMRSICEDINTLKVLEKNLDDKKSYTLSISQLIALGFN